MRFASYARQIEGCANRVAERIVGTKGVAEPSSGIITGASPFQMRKSPNPYVQEHTDLINAIRTGEPLNEGTRLGESTMTAICGRMSTYTGRMVEYDWARHESQESFSPEEFKFGDLPVAPVAKPGSTAQLPDCIRIASFSGSRTPRSPGHNQRNPSFCPRK